MIFLQVIDIEVLEQFNVDDCALVVFDVGALVKIGE